MASLVLEVSIALDGHVAPRDRIAAGRSAFATDVQRSGNS